MKYTAKITEAKIEMSLVDNAEYLDVRFNVLLNDEVVAERRLAFPLGTTEEVITAEVKKNIEMIENDEALAEEAQSRMAAKAESEKTLSSLSGIEIK